MPTITQTGRQENRVLYLSRRCLASRGRLAPFGPLSIMRCTSHSCGSRARVLPMPLTRVLRLLLKISVAALITLVLLETVTRVVWWQRDCLSFQDREICLLPYPILTPAHLGILDNFEQLERDGKNFDRFDPVLGWSVRPNSHTVENGTPYEFNDIGVRADRAYAPEPHRVSHGSGYSVLPSHTPTTWRCATPGRS